MDQETANSSPIQASTGYRYCVGCGKRMSTSPIFDSHVQCKMCRRSACGFENRCGHCEDWSDEMMQTYLNHQKTLERKNRYRECRINRKMSESSDKNDSQSLGLSSDDAQNVSVGLGSDHDNDAASLLSSASHSNSNPQAFSESMMGKLQSSIRKATEASLNNFSSSILP